MSPSTMTTRMPESPLTIAIPFYKGLDYLRQAIESVRRQSASQWQLLVVDDASPESGAEQLVQSYHDSRMCCHRNERNHGLAGNWNRCLDLAATDLVTLLHG